MAPRSHELPDDIKRRLVEARERAVQFADSLLAWRDELKRLHDLSCKFDLGFSTLEHRFRTLTTSDLKREILVQPQIARLIQPNAKNRELRTYELPAIVVTLDGTDAEIRAEFEAALVTAGRLHPTRLQKRGRTSKERQQPWPIVFLSWRDHDILPLAEFLIWRLSLTKQEQEIYSPKSYARWRRRNEYEDERSTKPAMQALGRAINSLPMLDRASRIGETPLDDYAWNLVAAWACVMEAEEKTRRAQVQAHDAEWLTLNRLLI